jgi:hypothetical protein
MGSEKWAFFFQLKSNSFEKLNITKTRNKRKKFYPKKLAPTPEIAPYHALSSDAFRFIVLVFLVGMFLVGMFLVAFSRPSF